MWNLCLKVYFYKNLKVELFYYIILSDASDTLIKLVH